MFSNRCKALADWYGHQARDLPWRRTADPYRIWISEIMLQQTQVATVLRRYHNWFECFPDIKVLASVSPDDVLKAWEGLGYYRRAHFIHAAAKQIVREHNGIFPRSFDGILKLPGIGRSTAGAIASFCCGQATPVLDGNVKRVLKRWHGMPDTTDTQLWSWAQKAIEASHSPANWNQAMMELGATVCRPKKPDCTACPVSAYCASAFRPETATGKKKHIPVRDVHWLVHLHTCPDKGLWLARRPDKGIWAGLWAPPITELEQPPEHTPCHIHTLTHRQLHLYGVQQTGEPKGKGQWFDALDVVALPTGIHRLLQKQGIKP